MQTQMFSWNLFNYKIVQLTRFSQFLSEWILANWPFVKKCHLFSSLSVWPTCHLSFSHLQGDAKQQVWVYNLRALSQNLSHKRFLIARRRVLHQIAHVSLRVLQIAMSHTTAICSTPKVTRVTKRVLQISLSCIMSKGNDDVSLWDLVN